MKLRWLALVLLCSLTQLGHAQYGDPLFRAKNVHNANQVRTTFYNYGLIGNIGEISFEWPQGTGNEYMGDFTPLWGTEFIHPNGDTLHSVTTSDGPRGNPDGPPGGGLFWGFEPLPDYFAVPPPDPDRMVAMSDQPDTWPSQWNGLWFGAEGPGTSWAAEESYFVVDDNRDGEWFDRADGGGVHHYLYPLPDDTMRRGLGLVMEVRMMEFTAWGYEDGLVIMYILHNDGVVEFTRMRFGFLVGTLSGGRQDSEDDLVGYDSELDVAYSFDGDDHGSPGWEPVSPNHNVGYAGIAFLKTPNDAGLTSLDEFSPPGVVRMSNDAALWQRLEPGHVDYDPGIPQDGDMMLGTSDFTVASHSADTVIAAIVFGEDLDDLLGNVAVFRQLVLDDFQTKTPKRTAPVTQIRLAPAYPNPFNAVTTLQLTLPRAAHVTLDLFDVTGRQIRNSADRYYSGGTHSIHVNAAGLASGTYIVRLTADHFTASQRIMLVR